MPAHSTMCIWHIGLSLLDLPQPFKDQEQCVYIHNSLSCHTNFSLLPLTTHHLIPYLSTNFSRISHFAGARDAKGKFFLSFLFERWGVSTSEKRKSEKIRQQGIYKIMYILMCSAWLCLHAFLMLCSLWLRHDVYKGQLVIRFFSAQLLKCEYMARTRCVV